MYIKTSTQVLADYNREKEFRMTLENLLEENKSLSQRDMARLEREISEQRDRIEQSQKESLNLRRERDTAIEKRDSARIDLDSLQLRVEHSDEQGRILQDEINLLRHRLTESEKQLDLNRLLLKEARESAAESTRMAQQYAAETISSFQQASSMTAKEIESSRAALEEQLRKSFEDELDTVVRALKSEHDLKYLELQVKIGSLESDVESGQSALQDKVTLKVFML